jgi:hypothetical protein
MTHTHKAERRRTKQEANNEAKMRTDVCEHERTTKACANAKEKWAHTASQDERGGDEEGEGGADGGGKEDDE